MKATWFLHILIFLILSVGCSNKQHLGILEISETAGFDRALEYVRITVPVATNMQISSGLMARNTETDETVAIQMLPHIYGKDSVTLMFPVDIKANQSKSYEILPFDKKMDTSISNLVFSEDGPSIENKFFKVSLSTETDARGGQINGIFLKNFKGQLLKRGHISMHWAPNFSKSDSDSYFNFEDMSSDTENALVEYRYHLEKARSGRTDSVPEIDLEGRYTFFDGLPYFIFESTMTMNQKVELNLLRNDEMTMDSLFTHVVYRERNGHAKHLALYENEIDGLEENPIPDDADFVAFYHSSKGYGFGSIRLQYDNADVEGNTSPLNAPYTKISKSRGNGRYWNRVLSDTIQSFPKGSRYYEENAYLIFDASGEVPEVELLRYVKQLNNPLKIKVSVESSRMSG